MRCNVVVGHYCSYYPCIRAFPECLPYSLYINIFKERRPFGRHAKF
nr:MAG TPA: hypothetical protein [Caudoviricetes sp.]